MGWFFFSDRCRHSLRCSLLGGLVSVLSGCTQIPFIHRAPEVNLALQVQPTPEQGVYAIAGATNLPDNTALVVMAVRYLHPTEPVATSQTHPTYAILAYNTLEVNAGRWQTELPLWQVAPDGTYQESWQADLADLDLSVEPDPTVQFLVTLAPQGVLASLEQQLQRQGLRLPRSLTRVTSEGDIFLQAEQQLAIALPTGQTTPPPADPADENGGWGKRYLLVPEPPLPYTLEAEDQRKLEAPAAQEEYLF